MGDLKAPTVASIKGVAAKGVEVGKTWGNAGRPRDVPLEGIVFDGLRIGLLTHRSLLCRHHLS